MATIGEHISILRTLIRSRHQDTQFDDQTLYQVLISARAVLLKRKLNKFNYISKLNYQTICVPLTESPYHDCSCAPDGCKVMKSDIEIPEVLTFRHKSTMKVYSIDGEEIYFESPQNRKNNKYSKFKKDKWGYYLKNGKLILWTYPFPVMVTIEAIFSDPADLSDIPECDDNGDPLNTICFDILSDDLPIDDELVYPMYEMSASLLGFAIKIPDDELNDNRDNRQVKVQ